MTTIDLFRLQSDALPARTRLVSFRGSERLCRPFEFEIFFVLVDENDFDMAQVVGAKATLTVDRGDGRLPLPIHGVFSALQHLHEVDGRALFRGVLVPRLWRLSQTHHSRLFTKKTVPEVIEALLRAAELGGNDYELRLDHAYPTEEHICQYQESDLDFLHRWMEVEGIYYFFEHREDREVLIVTDHASFHRELEERPIRYHPLAGDDRTAGECFDSLTCQHAALPAAVRLTDYDYAKPALEMAGKASVSPTGFGEVRIHGSRFFTPDRGKRLAEVRSEELRAKQVVAHATGTAIHLRSGYKFAVSHHPREGFNGAYLATAVRHFGNQISGSPEMRRLVRSDFDDTYRVEVTAIRADVQFRPERTTQWPRIYGFENGVVDGEAESEYAQLDDQGRYLVKFNFDESDLRDGKASTRVRMMQPHGGGVEGWHFPLRKGTEVVLSFLGGDPDRPVISGVVPNALTQSPVTAANHTKNVIQTGGRNRIEIEDTEGREQIALFSPEKKTYLRLGFNMGGNIDMGTDGDENVVIGGDTIRVTKGNKNEKILGNKMLWVNQETSEVYHGPHHVVDESGLRAEIDGGASYVITGGETRQIQGWYNLEPSHMKIQTGALHVFASSEMFANTGPVDWVTPSYIIKTPDFHVVGASHKNISSSKAEFVGIKAAFHGLDAKYVAMESKVFGTSVSAGAQKLDMTGLKIDLYGVKQASVGAKINQVGNMTVLAGINSIVAGMTTIA